MAPDSLVERLRAFLGQNGGVLSKRAREGEFSGLTPREVDRIEAIYAEAFGRV